jgi:hypothetical protein
MWNMKALENKMADSQIRVFNTRREVVAALHELEREGVPSSSITVMSSEPLHLEALHPPKTRIAGFAIAGGVLGAVFAILLTVLTSRRVGLVTGGMPIVSPWAFGIIVFELTALGAILATLVRMIFEARLLRHSPVKYDEAVAVGRIVLSVICADDDVRHIGESVLGASQKPDTPSQNNSTSE